MIQEIKKAYIENNKLSLLIRHGDRDKILKGTFGDNVLLNDIGINNSIEFGKSLSQMKINRILTSPIGRCVQTAEYIKTGYNRDVEIVETLALGAPGLHISDAKLAGEYYLKFGIDKIYKMFLEGVKIPGVPTDNEFNRLMSDFLITNTYDNGITIFVTHDILIALYHYCISKTIYTKENWVKYLSGIILKDGKYEK